MFDFTGQRPHVWPKHLRRLGTDEAPEESFDAWWAQHHDELAHLDPQIAEQWIYRHFDKTEFSCLPLDTLSWERRALSADDIVTHVRRELGRRLDPEWDYEQMRGLTGFPVSPVVTEFEATGSWTFPIVALSVPAGWHANRREYPDARLMLVEGHSRQRYLNAAHAQGVAPPGPHEVFVLHSPLAG
jgi:hypothetical protein